MKLQKPAPKITRVQSNQADINNCRFPLTSHKNQKTHRKTQPSTNPDKLLFGWQWEERQ